MIPGTPDHGTRVTCEDSDGNQETKVICDDWLLITDGRFYLAGVQSYANGTAVITVKRDAAAPTEAKP